MMRAFILSTLCESVVTVLQFRLKLLLPHVHTIFLLQETRGTMLLSTPGSHITPPGPVLPLLAPYDFQYHPTWPPYLPSLPPPDSFYLSWPRITPPGPSITPPCPSITPPCPSITPPGPLLPPFFLGALITSPSPDPRITPPGPMLPPVLSLLADP